MKEGGNWEIHDMQKKYSKMGNVKPSISLVSLKCKWTKHSKQKSEMDRIGLKRLDSLYTIYKRQTRKTTWVTTLISEEVDIKKIVTRG